MPMYVVQQLSPDVYNEMRARRTMQWTDLCVDVRASGSIGLGGPT